MPRPVQQQGSRHRTCIFSLQLAPSFQHCAPYAPLCSSAPRRCDTRGMGLASQAWRLTRATRRVLPPQAGTTAEGELSDALTEGGIDEKQIQVRD
jgi:hypothetical protein